MGVGKSLDVDDDDDDEMLSVGSAGLRTTGGAGGGEGGSVGRAPGGNVEPEGEGESSSSDEISPGSSRISIFKSSLGKCGRRMARLRLCLVS